ncbi:MAG TPA: glycine cleavage T C-terminal barrel domain-containing protein [Tepidiformaceae bacterium]
MTEPPAAHLLLHDMHLAAGATFAAYCGWSLPHDYGDAIAEYRAFRSSAAAVDRSFQSRLLVTGGESQALLVSVFGETIDELQEAEAIRTVALDNDGTVRDFAVVARTGAASFLIIGEPGQRQETARRLRDAILADWDVRVDDRTETTCLVGIVGPEAAMVVSNHLSDGLPDRVPGMHCVAFEALGFRSLAIRISDTGDDGFALMLAPGVARHAFESVRAAGVSLAGHAAQTVARVEACIPAFSPDLEVGLNPAEADLAGLVSGASGPVRRMLSAMRIGGDVAPATGVPITLGPTAIGEVRSSVRSPLLASTIALCVVEARQSLPGTVLDVAGSPTTVVTKPFYRRRN